MNMQPLHNGWYLHCCYPRKRQTLIARFEKNYLASQVVAKYGREQVLEWYLNTVEFGHYAYGIEAASQTYLRKTSAELTLPDAAMLAGVSLAPAINPWDFEAGAKVLQQEVLKQMAVQRMITTEIFRTALQVPVQITEKQSNPSSKWPAFTAQTISQLEKALGKNMVERGGLLVQTSLDLDLQTQTDCVLRRIIIRINAGSSRVYFTTCSMPGCQVATSAPAHDTITAGEYPRRSSGFEPAKRTDIGLLRYDRNKSGLLNNKKFSNRQFDHPVHLFEFICAGIQPIHTRLGRTDQWTK